MTRKIIGTVVSNQLDKTVTVSVTRLKQHPLYRKQFKVTKKFLAHDPDNLCGIGDKVEISETRPISRRKRWLVESILEKGVTV